ncbi:aspartyl-trna synthetase [Ophiostoma piceae UAMH 11346]|uniref:Probable aspartate--tRNA ligase, cytoplasmic n=1 Tax=Ophiostoma piceae (strain UAMH 11346) TaxID=1262450 RepID=S3CP83_OPHP1|nr:aspartyl-trna synthetase [Ophiostoma piceae UAMH 11346]
MNPTSTSIDSSSSTETPSLLSSNNGRTRASGRARSDSDHSYLRITPRTLKEPLLKLNRLVGHSTAKNHMSKIRLGNTAALQQPSEYKEAEKAVKEQLVALEKKQEKESILHRRRSSEDAARAEDPPEIRARYGTTTGEDTVLGRNKDDETPLAELPGLRAGTPVTFVARLHRVRSISAKLAFLVFRQQVDTLQGVLHCRDHEVSENFVRWAGHLSAESLVHVQGVLQEPIEPIKGCSIHNVELLISHVHVLVALNESPPIDVYTMDRVEKLAKEEEADAVEYVHPMHTRVVNRMSFLRTPTMQAVMRIKSTLCQVYRNTLVDQGFIEVHTPKLQPAATESGAEVFKVKYFDRKAFLAQSPQLAKQLCMSADFDRVFEVGSVFRAENSNTHRHLTEYVSLDLEMVITKDYYDAMSLIDNLIKTMIRGVYETNRKEIDIIKTHFPHDDLVIPDTTVVLPFPEAIELLNASGWRDAQGQKASPLEDLSTPAEVRLGQLVKEKYNTDYYILDKFPRSARPFYAHLSDADPNYTKSFDIFLRGQEITTGGQRIHNVDALKKRMADANIDPADMEEYIQGFEWGVMPHAGCGIGLERLLFLMLNLKDVRNATLFPRDPKSLPAKPPSTRPKLTHPEADTIQCAIDFEKHGDAAYMPTVEELIANYGDATNTSWLDDRYSVWRHKKTGAAIGYAQDNGYALVMGNPLCDPRQYSLVIADFLEFLRTEQDLRPLWLLVSSEVESILSAKLGWNSMSCVAEERVAVDEAKRVKKKERQAEEAGVTVHVLDKGEPVPEDLRIKCDKRILDWKANRHGRQVHITEVQPWLDLPHRRFVWAEDANGTVAALIVLHDLAPAHGCQIKFALNFPGAPHGTIELAISRAISHLASAGIKMVTFGAGATQDMEFGPNLQGTLRAKILSRTYRTVAEQLRLHQKTEFREKFGAVEDPVYICYPHLGLGVSGARTLIKFFEDEM